MSDTSIEWTGKTWNPTRGCLRVSPGCGGGCVPDAADLKGGCYAERQAARFSGPGQPYEGLVTLGKNGPRWTGKGRLVSEMLNVPVGWKKPQTIFVNSMSDLFFEAFSNEEIAAVFGVMAACPQHTFQVLTKRAKRMRDWFKWLDSQLEDHGPPQTEICEIEAENYGADIDRLGSAPWPLPNVHIGVSVENQEYADRRIPWLLETPAAIRFLSCEPLLGPVDLTRLDVLRDILTDEQRNDPIAPKNHHLNSLTGHIVGPDDILDAKIDWVIAGGESGPGARPCAIEWIQTIIKQCAEARVPCFVKQLGAFVVSEQRVFDDIEDQKFFGLKTKWAWRAGFKHRKGGDPSEWGTELAVRQMPGDTLPEPSPQLENDGGAF